MQRRACSTPHEAFYQSELSISLSSFMDFLVALSWYRHACAYISAMVLPHYAVASHIITPAPFPEDRRQS